MFDMPMYQRAPWVEPCDECGMFHRRQDGVFTCEHHRKERGVNGEKIPCMNFFELGVPACRHHAGVSREVRKAKAAGERAKFFVIGRVAQILEEYDVPDIHPLDGLLEVVRRTAGMVALLGGMVGELELTPQMDLLDVTDGGLPVYGPKGLWGPDHLGDQAANILVTLYGQWLDRHAKACKLALDADIDERLVRNAEATSDVLFRGVARALQEAGLEPDQARRFRQALARELREPLGAGVIEAEAQEAV